MNKLLIAIMMGLLMVTTPLAGCLDEGEPLPEDNSTEPNCEALICQCYEEYCDRDNNTTNEDNPTNDSSERENHTIGDCDAETCECDSRFCDENNNTIRPDWDNMTEEERCLSQGNEWHTWLDANNTTVGACVVICFPEPPAPRADDKNNTDHNSHNGTDIVCTTDLCWDGSSRNPADCSCPPLVNSSDNATNIIDNYSHTWDNDLFLLTHDNNSYTIHINESLNWSGYVVHFLEWPENGTQTSFYQINTTKWPDNSHYEKNLTINMSQWWAEGFYHAVVEITNCVPANGSHDCWEIARGNFSLTLTLEPPATHPCNLPNATNCED